MQAFFSDDQLLHDPQHFMRLGRICKPTDLPTRAEALMETLAARGIAVGAPPEGGRTALELVHSHRATTHSMRAREASAT